MCPARISKHNTCTNLKAQHMCDSCFEIHFETRVTHGTRSHIIYVGPGLMEFASVDTDAVTKLFTRRLG
jgi:hypothetical protein